MDKNKIQKGSIVLIQSDKVHQKTGKSLDGMHGLACSLSLNYCDEWIVSVSELNNIKVCLSEEELIVIDNTNTLIS